MTLLSLVNLELGRVCGFNTCRTTVSSLLEISVHCLGLTLLEIHFNTQTIVGDIKCLLDGGSGGDKPRCELGILAVGALPLHVGEEDVGTIARGFVDIFPCLEGFSSHRGHIEIWRAVTDKLED